MQKISGLAKLSISVDFQINARDKLTVAPASPHIFNVGYADSGTHHEMHYWFFTPLSFAELMRDLSAASYQAFKCANFHPNERHTNPFYLKLVLCADPTWAPAS